jgi:hypothetical protein
VTVLPINDAPVPKEIFDITINEDEEYTYIFEATDVEADTITFETNIRSKVKGLEKGKNYFFDERTGEMTITATNEMVGEYQIQLKVKDDGSPPKESDPIDFILYIDNTNDIPKNVQIIEPAPGAVFQKDDKINFLGSAEDDDLLIPDSEEILMYQWRSDKVIGLIGNSEQFSYEKLTVGEHKITLTVYDSMNDASSTSVTITIQGDTEGVTKIDPKEGSDEDSVMSNLWWILAALVVVIVFVLVITMVFMRKKKPELTPEEQQLQSYYEQLQSQGTFEETPMYGYGYQQPGMMGSTYPQTQYPQQQFYPQQQTAYPQPTAQPQPQPVVSPQAPAPAKVVGVIEPKVQKAPQLPPASENLQDLPKTKPVTTPTATKEQASKPKDWNWNY